MTKSKGMRIEERVERTGTLAAVVLAGFLGVVSIGGGCNGSDTGKATRTAGIGASSSSSSSEPFNESGSASNGDDSSNETESEAGVVQTSASSTGVAPSNIDAASQVQPAACGQDYQACGGEDGGCCVNKRCDMGICGGCFAEGSRCSYDGGVAPDASQPCCTGLACIEGFCGTSACQPDSTPCGPAHPDVVCCSGLCSDGTCSSN